MTQSQGRFTIEISETPQILGIYLGDTSAKLDSSDDPCPHGLRWRVYEFEAEHFNKFVQLLFSHVFNDTCYVVLIDSEISR